MGGKVLSPYGARKLPHSWKKPPTNRTPGRFQERTTWHSSEQKFLIVKKMSLNAFVHEKGPKPRTFLFISSALTHHGTSWQSVPSWIQKRTSPKSPQRVPRFLRFQESEDYQQCGGVTWHRINVAPISGQWRRCRLKTVSTSQISPKKLHTLPLGRSILPTISPFMACSGCSGNK